MVLLSYETDDASGSDRVQRTRNVRFIRSNEDVEQDNDEKDSDKSKKNRDRGMDDEGCVTEPDCSPLDTPALFRQLALLSLEMCNKKIPFLFSYPHEILQKKG